MASTSFVAFPVIWIRKDCVMVGSRLDPVVTLRVLLPPARIVDSSRNEAAVTDVLRVDNRRS